ncbi:hypothetical protein GXM_10254 [Nostoc sphaeroides CCNUC1]|uniref:Uncharacterized protein n=1 Tax=Nostoc sphaeroides CCNUC1 TaxID=2653204 RepID=A0A5P8WK99_9NOSO|nr:hypothetical protein GXM_10254 [Nostoc sphaeroides CCNUC1]
MACQKSTCFLTLVAIILLIFDTDCFTPVFLSKTVVLNFSLKAIPIMTFSYF